MKNSNLFLGVILLFTVIILQSCFEEDNSENINELIYNAGHFEAPEEYEPTQVGSPVTTTETNNHGVEYQVVTTNYKRAKKIENYKSIETSKKSGNNENAMNDIYLGSIIQGKYWREDGDLVSIGNFARAPLTITLEGVVLANGNSITVDAPTNASVNSALNQLFNSENGEIGADYNFSKTEAYSKHQAGLELGFKPAWLGDLFSVDFSIENTIETSTVIMYFKQKYFTVKVDMPGTPSDFFDAGVDFDGLKTKITPENPAGYISSIDYGRVIMAEVTSSYSATEITASVNAAFNALSINVGGHYEEVLENCHFECKVLGGNPSSLPQDAQGVIDLIEEGMSPNDLTTAKPISYQVSYLDGGIFRIGDVVEYPKKEFTQITDNQNFDIHLYGFYIYHDCDWSTNGDFSYSVSVNGEEIASHDNITTGNESFISIDEIKSLVLPAVDGQKVIVSGSLYEDNEIVQDFSVEFEYPWNDADLINATWTISGTETNLWERYLYRSDACDAYFLFKVEKK